MNINEKGYFICYKKIFMDESEWLAEPFTKSQALIDLFNLMQYEHEPTTKKFKRGRVIAHINRGQGAFTERELAERWQWSKSKVRVFLNNQTTPKERPNCDLKKNQHFTLITFCNYEELCRLPNNEKPKEKPNYDQEATKERPPYKDNGYTTELPNGYLSNPKDQNNIEKGGMGEKTEKPKKPKKEKRKSLHHDVGLYELQIHHIEEWLDKKNIPHDFALKKLEDLILHCEAKGGSYDNYRAAWQGFINRDYKPTNQPKGKPNDKLPKTNPNEITTSNAGQNESAYITRDGIALNPNNPLHAMRIDLDKQIRAEQAANVSQ